MVRAKRSARSTSASRLQRTRPLLSHMDIEGRRNLPSATDTGTEPSSSSKTMRALAHASVARARTRSSLSVSLCIFESL